MLEKPNEAGHSCLSAGKDHTVLCLFGLSRNVDFKIS